MLLFDALQYANGLSQHNHVFADQNLSVKGNNDLYYLRASSYLETRVVNLLSDLFYFDVKNRYELIIRLMNTILYNIRMLGDMN